MDASISVFSLQTLYYWIVAFSIWEAIAIVFILNVFHHKTVQEYYRRIPSWVTIGGDFLYSTLIFLTALGVYQYIPLVNKNVWLFVVIFIATQWVYDITFATIINRIPTYTRYIDYFQRYIKEVSFGAAISDTVYLLGWLAVTWLLMKYVSIPIATFILVFMLFLWIIIAY